MDMYAEMEIYFDIFASLYNEDELLRLKNTPERDLCLYHIGLGLWIRNNVLVEVGVLCCLSGFLRQHKTPAKKARCINPLSKTAFMKKTICLG